MDHVQLVKHTAENYGKSKFYHAVCDVLPHVWWSVCQFGTDVKILGALTMSFKLHGQIYKAQYRHAPLHGVWLIKNGKAIAGPFTNETSPQAIRELFEVLIAN